MNIHCPQCGHAFEPSSGTELEDVTCPSCSHHFNLAVRETVQVPDGGAGGPGSGTEADAQDSDSLPPNAPFGGYRILGEVGRGGMGIVYRAVQTSLDRVVAIKVLPRALSRDPQFVERFHREARTLAMLSHPHIVAIIDKGAEGDRYYFVMEWVEGLSLRDVMNQGRLAPAEALKIVPDICSALAYAHSLGVIHRDIKPENILLSTSGQVKIADFGLSKLVSGEKAGHGLTQTNMTMGTLNYMAPEQRERARDVDHRADLFSLGVVFYEMLTGELPMGRFEPPSRRNVELDVRLDEVVLKVLERDPERRYQQASDISEAVSGLSAARLGAAAGSGPAPRVRDSNSWAVVALVLGLLSLLSLFCMCPMMMVFYTKAESEPPMKSVPRPARRSPRLVKPERKSPADKPKPDDREPPGKKPAKEEAPGPPQDRRAPGKGSTR